MAIGLAVLIFLVAQVAWRYERTGAAFPSFRLTGESKQYLTDHFDYYRRLSAKDKSIFEKRLAYFLSKKKFIGRNGLELTHGMKLLISAAAIQLTFGFPKVHLRYFQYILIYPDTYYSTISRKYHVGEVNPRARAIVISWKYFLEGYLTKDGRNLALHEMAHALRLENRISNREYNFLHPVSLKLWEELAEMEMNKIQDQPDGFFRKYAAENREEFFCVAVENFFDRPEEFYAYHPGLYEVLAKLLKQDPKQH